MTEFERTGMPRLSPDIVELVVRRIEMASGDTAPLVNCRSALERLNGDAELFQDLLEFFFNDAPGQLAAIDTAIAEGNAENLHRSAHRLKGLLSNIDALQAVEAAR